MTGGCLVSTTDASRPCRGKHQSHALAAVTGGLRGGGRRCRGVRRSRTHWRTRGERGDALAGLRVGGRGDGVAADETSNRLWTAAGSSAGSLPAVAPGRAEASGADRQDARLGWERTWREQMISGRVGGTAPAWASHPADLFPRNRASHPILTHAQEGCGHSSRENKFSSSFLSLPPQGDIQAYK